MMRGVIIISGDVQGAGYRAFVMKLARKSKLVGYMENMPDGNVKVVCEGKKDSIECFVSAVNIKTWVVEVEDIKVDYCDATGEFDGKGFDIKVEESFKGMIRELFQGYVTSEKYFNKGFEKQDTTIDVLKDFRDSTKQSFTDMGNRYGSIQDELVNTRKELAKLVKHIGVLVEEHIKRE